MQLSPATACLLLCLGLTLGGVKADEPVFLNDWDRPLKFECPAGQFISDIYSVHHNHYEDRRWQLGCSPAPYGALYPKCTWSADYVNNWDKPINFLCPANYAVSGVESYHNNHYEDRRMKFKCCRPLNYKTSSCTLTPYLNGWDAVLNYTVPDKRVLAGWFSYHDNHYEDRRHKMLTCLYRL